MINIFVFPYEGCLMDDRDDDGDDMLMAKKYVRPMAAMLSLAMGSLTSVIEGPGVWGRGVNLTYSSA